MKTLLNNKEETMEENRDEPKVPILFNRYDYAEGKCGYVIPDGYEFDCIKEGFQTEIILKPKKPQYPKDYVECCECLKHTPFINNVSGYKRDTIAALQTLITCRDAYWKLAGTEMGLDKPWKPEWASGKPFYCISVNGNIIDKGKWYTDNKILAFPTPEMRDAFYENFRELIEQCKELL